MESRNLNAFRQVDLQSNQMAAKRKGELFRRIRPSQLARLLRGPPKQESLFETEEQQKIAPQDSISQVFGQVSEQEEERLKKDYLILDLREPEEFYRFHISEAVCFPAPNVTRDRMIPQIFRLKNQVGKLIIIYAQDERPGVESAQKMASRGFQNVYLLTGGLKEFSGQYHDLLVGMNLPPPPAPSQWYSSNASTVSSYLHYHIDPSMVLDWNEVLSVTKLCQTKEICPICHQFLNTGLILKCTHIFCADCILRFLPDQGSRKCPICKTYSAKQDLRLIETISSQKIQIGEEVEMTLMSSIPQSVTVVEAKNRIQGHFYQRSLDSRCSSALFNRFTVNFDPVQKIQNMIRGQTSSLLTGFVRDLVQSLPKTQEITVSKFCDCNTQYHPVFFYPVSFGPCERHLPEVEKINTHRKPSIDNSKYTDYFYQISGFQYCFLHPSCLKDLNQQLDELPSSFSAKVLFIQNLRAPNKKLARSLPSGTAFQWVYLDLSHILERPQIVKLPYEKSEEVTERAVKIQPEERKTPCLQLSDIIQIKPARSRQRRKRQ